MTMNTSELPYMTGADQNICHSGCCAPFLASAACRLSAQPHGGQYLQSAKLGQVLQVRCSSCAYCVMPKPGHLFTATTTAQCQSRVPTNLLWWLGHQSHTVLLAVIQSTVAIVRRQGRSWQGWNGFSHLDRCKGFCRVAQFCLRGGRDTAANIWLG